MPPVRKPEAFTREAAKRQFVAELAAGTAVDDIFFLREVEKRDGRGNRPYLALRLSDRTGIIDGRIWEQADTAAASLRPDTFVSVRGGIEAWRGRLQINVRQAAPVAAGSLDQGDFLPATYRDTEELAGFLDYFLTEVYDPDYRRLLQAFFGDGEFVARFSRSPGAVRSHHAYLGGLLEHTISVTTLCQHACVQHPRLNSDLLVTAALLHDVGKLEEFSCEGRIRYSRPGRMLGHVLLGQRMIEERVRALDGFPEEKELELVHAVISHHGELEWGAPKRPASAEALVLHHIDNLDARVKGFFEVVAGKGELPWPEVQNFFRRPLTEPLAADREPGRPGS